MPTALMIDLIRGHMRQRPGKPAIYQHEAWLAYGELAIVFDTFSAHLRHAVPEHATVTVRAARSAEGIALLLACWAAGYRTLLVAPGSGEDLVRLLSERAGSVATIASIGRELVITPHRTDAAHSASGPALLYTTSGSTGTPQIVECAASGIDAFTAWVNRKFGLNPDRVVLSYAPLNFDISLLDVWAPLAAGGKVALVAPDQALAGNHLIGVVERTCCAVIQAVPLFFDLFVEAAGDRDFPSVEQVIFTGDVMSADTLKRLPEVFPAAAIKNVYGCTETNDSFLHEVDQATAMAGGPVPIGTPIAGVHELILDDNGSVVADAGEGELLVSTPFQARGYLDPAATAVKWITMFDGVRYFHSGDIVRRDAAGITHLVGRKDSRIKVRGVTTDLQEVERVISQHPAVAEVAVVAVPSAVAGHELNAIIRSRDGAELTGLLVRQYCAARLPLTAVPTRIELADRLPRTVTGKLDRALIAQQSHLRPDSVESEVRDFIIGNFARDVVPTDLDNDLDLINNAVMNSLQVLRLISWIGGHYGIPLKDVQISPQDFRSVASIAHFVLTRLEARQ
jgi:acyl-coenzyme A synthetase/AMP-(fatty) acid ligase/acyl carrier protein